MEEWWWSLSVLTGGLVGASISMPDETSRADTIAALGQRLTALIDDDVEEAFLVRSLRRVLDDWFEKRADIADANRIAAQFREARDRLIQDPVALQEIRDEFLEEDPAAASMTAEDVVRRLEANGSKFVQPVDADDARQRWAAASEWQRLVAESLSDLHIERWQFRRLARDL
jgi:hypothetical protein